ncbi:MAG: protein kinase [Synergistota bacterium]|nr:protein kinase [Synergistota bacterium]
MAILKKGKKLTTELYGWNVRVEKKLAEGGQGAVYLVDTPEGERALKWYAPLQATQIQRKTIAELCGKGAPRTPESAGKRFVWPLDLVKDPEDDSTFGYVMELIDTDHFLELGEVQGRKKIQPSLRNLCRICFLACQSYRALHLAGFCYRDISSGNLLFDPKDGNVLICDNDNVGVDGSSEAQVLGTVEYMAPEIILGTGQPCTDTDLYSLAVLFFQLWMWHHPMHGKMEYDIRLWDLSAKKRIYGEQPVFIFNPQDKRNEPPDDPEYNTVKKRWEICPPSLKNLFIRTFTEGLDEPKKRVTEGEWAKVFLQLADNTVTCKDCNAENLWDEKAPSRVCWNCGKSLPNYPKLELKGPYGSFSLLLKTDFLLKNHHFAAPADIELEHSVKWGGLRQNPNNPSVWGLQNLSSDTWKARFPDGSEHDIPEGLSVPLRDGVVIELPQQGNSPCTILIKG